MQKNIFKARLQAGEQQLGLWAMLANSGVLEVMTQTRFDWILIDTEHSANELPMVQDQLRSIAQSGMPALVRPACNDSVIIKRLLDVGVQTLLIPMVDTPEQARNAVAAMHYPPAGIRGVSSGTRANLYGTDLDYYANANSQVCLLVQIESLLGMQNIEEIAAVKDIDGLFIGPSDLAASMGHLGNTKHPEVQAAIFDALKRCHAMKKPMGILMTDPVLAGEYVRAGFDYVAAVTDISILRAGTEAALKHFSALKPPLL